MLSSSVGQLLINDALPEDMRDYNRVLDGKAVKSLLKELATKHPDKYRDVSFKLNQIAKDSVQEQGGLSFGARSLRKSKAASAIQQKISADLAKILEDETLTDKQRSERIIRVVGKEMDPQIKAVLDEATKENNPLALQVLSGSRGKPMNLASLLGSDLLYSDHRDEVIPIPVLRSYSQGLSPEEYWAGTYGARRGIIATKFATQEAGFLSKQLNQAGHRLVVVGEEGEDDPTRGMVVDTDDEDNEGSLLARDIGPYKRNTPLTPKILKEMSRLGFKKILIRSPLVGGSPSGGVYARDVGIRETGKLPGRGEQVGLQAAQALSEPISQGQLSSKHSGGVAGQEKAVSGFQYINQLIQAPKRFQGGAAHSEKDGTVQRIEEAPAGGNYVFINDQKHYVSPGYKLKVKKGDEVEAGDLLSEGIPNPALIVKHKGVGEGRRYFVNEFRKAMASGGMRGHRRNIELLARGLINHVKLNEETEDNSPDDVIPYSTLEHTYKPREGFSVLSPRKAVGSYLEKPILHYTIGTKLRPSMLKDLESFGINEVTVHKDPPIFEPYMVRGMYQLQHDPDWMTQMYGSGLKKSLLGSVARGATSEERGTSFVPSLASTTDFGESPEREVINPQKPYELPEVNSTTDSGQTFFGGRFKLGMHKKAEPISQSSGVDTRQSSDISNLSSQVPASNTPTQPNNQNDNLFTPGFDLVNTANPSSSQTAQTVQNQKPKNNTSVVQSNLVSAPPSNQSQAKTDSVQQSRGNNSILTNPAVMSQISQYSAQDPIGGLMAMLMGTNSKDFMTLFGNKTMGRDLSIDNLLPSDTTRLAQPPASSSTNNSGIVQALGDGARMTSTELNAVRAIQSAAAGKAFSGPATSAANTIARKAVKPIVSAANAAQKVPVVKHFVPSFNPKATATAADTAADIAKTSGRFSRFLSGAGKFLGPAAVALETAGVASDVYNKGWDQTTNDTAQNSRELLTNWDRGLHEIYRKPIDVAFHVLNPVTTAQSAAGLVTQTGGTVSDIGKNVFRSVSDWWNKDDDYYASLPKSHVDYRPKE